MRVGSKEELDDLKAAYVECEGDLGEVIDHVMCATEEDEGRFRKILRGLVSGGELPQFESFSNESPAKRTLRKKKVGQSLCPSQSCYLLACQTHTDTSLSLLDTGVIIPLSTTT